MFCFFISEVLFYNQLVSRQTHDGGRVWQNKTAKSSAAGKQSTGKKPNRKEQGARIDPLSHLHDPLSPPGPHFLIAPQLLAAQSKCFLRSLNLDVLIVWINWYNDFYMNKIWIGLAFYLKNARKLPEQQCDQYINKGGLLKCD